MHFTNRDQLSAKSAGIRGNKLIPCAHLLTLFQTHLIFFFEKQLKHDRMNPMSRSLCAALVISCTIMLSCGKNSAKCGGNLFGELDSETQALTTTLTAYSQDASVANCEKYKDALADYFNAFSGLRSCYGIGDSKAQFDAAIKDAKDSLDDWEC